MPGSVAKVSSFLLSCAVLWSTVLACTPGSEPKPLRDVLLITVDTLRADFLESYAPHGVPTPGITALAERGARFEKALAASSATAPSHASIMTSRFARHHSVGPFNGNTRLEGVPTLAESFHEAGFETGAFVSNAVLLRRVGMDGGFDHYDDEVDRVEPKRPTAFERRADATAQRAIAWLRDRGDQPFFAWVHFQDPHGPYTPPPPFDTVKSRFPLQSDAILPTLRGNSGRGGIPFYQRQPGLTRPSEYAARYAGEIAYMDEWLSKVVAEAERASGNRGLVIAVTADHGESFEIADWADVVAGTDPSSIQAAGTAWIQWDGLGSFSLSFFGATYHYLVSAIGNLNPTFYYGTIGAEPNQFWLNATGGTRPVLCKGPGSS